MQTNPSERLKKKQHASSLSDKEMGETILQQLSAGLSKIDSSQLPRIVQGVVLSLHSVPKGSVAYTFICKWLGQASLNGWDSHHLPLKSITFGNKRDGGKGSL